MKSNFTRMGVVAVAAACAWFSTVGAWAAPVDVGLGGTLALVDPSGSGRQVPVQFTGGPVDLAFDNGQFNPLDEPSLGGAVGAFNAIGLRLDSIGVVQPMETFLPSTSGEPYRATAGVAGIRATQLSVDDVTGQILSVGTTGGFTLTGSRISGVLTGGEARIENLRFDLANRRVLADLSGTRDAAGGVDAVHFDLPGAVLWDVASVSGPAFLAPSVVLSSNPAFSLAASGFDYVPASATATGLSPALAIGVDQFSGFTLTPEAYGFLVDSLGLLRGGQAALQGVNDFGSAQTRVAFALGVPEPQTFALMGLGLCFMAGAVRRNTRRTA